MKSVYTVETRNKFSFLDDEASDSDRILPSMPDTGKGNQATSRHLAGTAAKKPIANEPPANEESVRTSRGGGRRGRGGFSPEEGREGRGGSRVGGRGGYRDFPEEGRPPRGGRGEGFRGGAYRGGGGPPKGDRPEEEIEEGGRISPARDRGRRGGGYRGGRGGGRGGYGDRTERTRQDFAVGRDREFDRHSGTGRGFEMKKGGGGAHNWGNTTGDETPTEDKTIDTTSDMVNQSPTRSPYHRDELSKDKVAEGEENVVSEIKPQEPVQIDVTEYKRQQEAKRANLPKLPSGQARTISATDMENEGYAIYVKPTAFGNVVEVEQTSEKEDDADKPKKKELKMSIFEYAEMSGVKMPNKRRGGRVAGRGDFNRGDRTENRDRFDNRGERAEVREREDKDFSKTQKTSPPKSLQITLSDQAEFPSLDARK